MPRVRNTHGHEDAGGDGAYMKKDVGRLNSDKILYLDVLRAWACISVVVIHVSAYYTQAEVTGMDYLIGNVFNSIARAAVPLFVMISGALMLDESYNCTKEKLKRMIKNRLLFFIIWSLLYAVVFQVLAPQLKGDEVSLEAFLQSLMSGHHHLWFIPMLIGLYLILPLLRLWVKKENKRYVEYYLLLCFVFTSALPFLIEKLSNFFPLVSCVYSLTDNMHLQYVAGYTGYYVLGWYLNTFSVRRRGIWYTAGVLGLLLTFAGTQIFSVLKGEEKNFYSVFAINIVFYASALFLLVKSLLYSRKHDSGVPSRFVRLICQNSMGIYAMHPAIIQALFKILGVRSAVILIPLVSLSSLTISLIAAQVLRRLPAARTYML